MKLTGTQIHAAYVLWKRGEAVKVLAHRYGVNYQTMLKYLRQKDRGVI